MKNPISVAFGHTLRTLRNEYNIPIEELVKLIGINHSYYRLIESGIHSIHISKTMDLVSAFNHFGASIDYEGTQKLLMGVYFTQPLTKLAENGDKSFNSAKDTLLSKLMAYDPKIYRITTLFDELNLFESTELNGKEVVNILTESGLAIEFKMFLTNFKSFGKTSDEIESDYLKSFFDRIPSLYNKLIYDFRANIKSLPSNIGVSNLWEWEDANGSDFRELYAYVVDSSSISSIDNLERYNYKYLWNDPFAKARIFYSSPEKEEQVEKLFKKNLAAVHNVNQKDLKFKKAVSKVKFKRLENLALPSHSIFLENRGVSYEPNATWVFALKENINVGFLAQINAENDLLSNGESLPSSEAIKLLSRFRKLTEKNGL